MLSLSSWRTPPKSASPPGQRHFQRRRASDCCKEILAAVRDPHLTRELLELQGQHKPNQRPTILAGVRTYRLLWRPWTGYLKRFSTSPSPVLPPEGTAPRSARRSVSLQGQGDYLLQKFDVLFLPPSLYLHFTVLAGPKALSKKKIP